MTDAANFSDFVGHVDEVLLHTEVTVVNIDEKNTENCLLLRVSPRHEIYKATMLNGEIVVLKTVKQHHKYSDERNITVLTYEAKILRQVGVNCNVVKAFGIATVKSLPALVLKYESDLTLDVTLRKNNKIEGIYITRILKGIASGLTHIHEKFVLHNQITPNNVCLRRINTDPVIIGFSCACRMASSKRLTIIQQRQFKDCIHLPDVVRTGRSPPSRSSDIYSFGHLVRQFVLKVRHAQSIDENKIYQLSSKLLRNDGNIDDDLDYLVEEYTDDLE